MRYYIIIITNIPQGKSMYGSLKFRVMNINKTQVEYVNTHRPILIVYSVYDYCHYVLMYYNILRVIFRCIDGCVTTTVLKHTGTRVYI